MKLQQDTKTSGPAPWVASIPLSSDRARYAHVIVYQGKAVVPAEGLRLLQGFHADGQGGWISAAQAGNGRFGYLDGEGRWRVPPTLEDARTYSWDGLARFRQGGLWGFVDLAGQVVVPPRFADARPFRGGLCAVKVGDGAWRIIDREGRFTCSESFHDLSVFGANGLARAVAQGTGRKPQQRLQGFVDREGRWVVEPGLAAAHPFGELGVTPASLDGDAWGLIDARGKWVLKPRYPEIGAFNSEGLAFFKGAEMWDRGYLDAKGRVVVQGEHHLSEHMVHGMVVDSYNGSEFRQANGMRLATPALDYGTAFQVKSGVAVVRASERQGDGARRATWGLLHTDGRVFTVGDALLEPMTDRQGWLEGEDAHAPLLQFLARDGSVAWVDREGAVVWRARYDGPHATLFDAEGHALWRSDAQEDCRAPRSYLHPPATQYLEGLAMPEEIDALARTLLDEAEAQVHRLAAGETLERESVSEGYGSDYWDDDDGEYEDTVQANHTVVVRRVARAYLDEEHCSPYDFLGAEHARAMDQLQDAMVKTLAARYGAPDPGPEHAAPLKRPSGSVQAFAVPLAHALPGDSGELRESREQWLMLYCHCNTGDGDMWSELWLVAAPSLDALETAQHARDALDLTEDDGEDEQDEGEEDEEDGDADPETYEEWLQALRDERSELGYVPMQWRDAAMVDAALAHDAKALTRAPVSLQTPGRLEALIRRDLNAAVDIPAPCMTTEGLALARQLYAGNERWDAHDKGCSRIPAVWYRHSVSSVWGCLLTPAHVHQAVQAEAPLNELPAWLRTDAVEAAALEADIDNIGYLDPAKITPALAEHAVRRKGRLIKEIPSELVTPALCLAAAHSNGEAMRWIPEPLLSREVCTAGLRKSPHMLLYLPEELQMAVVNTLLEEDLAGARKQGKPRAGSGWHGLRAWLKYWDEDLEGALADARLGLSEVRFPQHMHYLMACAYKDLGHQQEAALQAAQVLDLESPYTAEWDDDEDTSWLKPLARSRKRR